MFFFENKTFIFTWLKRRPLMAVFWTGSFLFQRRQSIPTALTGCPHWPPCPETTGSGSTPENSFTKCRTVGITGKTAEIILPSFRWRKWPSGWRTAEILSCINSSPTTSWLDYHPTASTWRKVWSLTSTGRTSNWTAVNSKDRSFVFLFQKFGAIQKWRQPGGRGWEKAAALILVGGAWSQKYETTGRQEGGGYGLLIPDTDVIFGWPLIGYSI